MTEGSQESFREERGHESNAPRSQARHCWKKLGRCRTTCKDSEVFYLLCNDETKCCVNPKHVPVKTRSLPPTGSLE
ncbi:beta-defensin 121 isoform X2 [Acinonyx jubatus]|uniref:Beta-defensin n=1 Tax=Acinonyx jubatus TaxID=32536 RepID=A0ABM3N9I4_ACIJB|nr:beta-defensin 121 isoform X2 [Acinonyx jubatus]